MKTARVVKISKGWGGVQFICNSNQQMVQLMDIIDNVTVVETSWDGNTTVAFPKGKVEVSVETFELVTEEEYNTRYQAYKDAQAAEKAAKEPMTIGEEMVAQIEDKIAEQE